MNKTPLNTSIGRALADQAELDESALDRIVGGAGPGAMRQETDDGWSKIIDDHSKQIPAKPAPTSRQPPPKPDEP